MNGFKQVSVALATAGMLASGVAPIGLALAFGQSGSLYTEGS